MRHHFISAYLTGGRGRSASYVKPTMGRPPRDHDDLPDKIGIGAPYNRDWDRRSHNQSKRAYNLPKRWLAARNGMRWDDVWSEVCSAIDGRSDVGAITRKAILRAVERDTLRDSEGVVCTRSVGWRHRKGCLVRACPPYVDPEGILHSLETRTVRAEPERSSPDIIKTGDLSEIHRIDGIWYEITWRPLPDRVRTTRLNAAGEEEEVWVRPDVHSVLPSGQGQRTGYPDRTKGLYAAAKRQLSTADLIAHDVVNDAERETPPKRRKGSRH